MENTKKEQGLYRESFEHAGQAPAHGRSSQDEKIITDAKLCLIRKNHLTEEQAHRHLQQLSMA